MFFVFFVIVMFSIACLWSTKNNMTNHVLLPTCQKLKRKLYIACILVTVSILLACSYDEIVARLYESPCLLRNNYLLMEATRPLTECHICQDVHGPIVLENPSRQDFSRVAYSSKPILVKGAAREWPALKVFSLDYFAKLYDGIPGAYQSVEDECQFLPFKTDFLSLRDALEAGSHSKREPWYIGWSNCHPKVRDILRSFYDHPDFLPEDSESSALDWIFMGSPGLATTMHLDYVLRPSWQAQISGRKLWQLLPPPECESFCQGLNITVEAGDIVLVDTNQWYHTTYVLADGGLSISIGSEYD